MCWCALYEFTLGIITSHHSGLAFMAEDAVGLFLNPRHLSHPSGSCWWVPIEAALLRRDNGNGERLSEISPMKVWGQSGQGRLERGGPSILLY